MALFLVLAWPGVAGSASNTQKQKRTQAKPLVPIQLGSDQEVVSHESGSLYVTSVKEVEVIGKDSAQRIHLGVLVDVSAKLFTDTNLNISEITLTITYAVGRRSGERAGFPMPDYVIDTTKVRVTDGEGRELERVSLANHVNETLDLAAANIQTFVPPFTPPVRSSSTYYIDCFGYAENTASCRVTPEDSSADGPQQAGYVIAMAIRAWRVKHHNEKIRREMRELLGIYQDYYLRDRLAFLGNNLAQESAKGRWQIGFVDYRRPDAVRPVGPFKVQVPIPNPSGPEQVFTFQFAEGP